MSSKDAAMEAALLEIAKDLLQASDGLASIDPSSSAKLANEAYEIGRDLGIVRNHVGDMSKPAETLQASVQDDRLRVVIRDHKASSSDHVKGSMTASASQQNHVEDDADDELLRILDRQKAMLPGSTEQHALVRKPSRASRSVTFEATQPRRSSWFGWMRSREWRHAG